MSSPEHRRLTVVHGAAAFVAVLLVVQMWLLAATLEAYLGGHEDAARPGAIVSGILFAACACIDWLVARVGR